MARSTPSFSVTQRMFLCNVHKQPGYILICREVIIYPGLVAYRSRQDVAALRDGVDISIQASRYLQGRRGTARYASFDYCFNYFQSFHDEGRASALAEAGQLEASCLQLGFYLASWGMFRGKAALLQHSAKSLGPAVRVVAAAPEAVWHADADDYGPPVQSALSTVYRELRASLPGGQSQTLVTKTMLGVFGCVPAFDRYFRDAFGAATFGPKSLAGLESYYQANAAAIDANRIATLDFVTGADSHRYYTRAKVIDMVFFTKGLGSELSLGLAEAPREELGVDCISEVADVPL
jgi:hypothetical protein